MFRKVVRFILPLVIMLLVGTAYVFAQVTYGEGAPGIDQIVSSLMAAGGTYLAAYLVNYMRVKWNIVPGSIFVMLLVPALGALISYLVGFISQPDTSWLIRFLVSFISVWLSQVIAQLSPETGAKQYLISNMNFKIGSAPK